MVIVKNFCPICPAYRGVTPGSRIGIPVYMGMMQKMPVTVGLPDSQLAVAERPLFLTNTSTDMVQLVAVPQESFVLQSHE